MTNPSPSARWSGSDYSRSSAHHRGYDEMFLARHQPRPTDAVVDLGCGSGEFTAQLADLVPRGSVTGVDQDESMLAEARRHTADNLHFIHGSAQQLDELLAPGSVDLVVSRAMLHWVPASARPRVFAAVHRLLRPGGWLHLECAGTGNIGRISVVLNELAAAHGLPGPPPFPDTADVFDSLEEAGFEIPPGAVGTVAHRRSFSRDQIEALLRTQATLVLTRHTSGPRIQEIVEQAVASIDRLRRHDGSYDQTFVRLELLVRRPDEVAAKSTRTHR